ELARRHRLAVQDVTRSAVSLLRGECNAGCGVARPDPTHGSVTRAATFAGHEIGNETASHPESPAATMRLGLTTITSTPFARYRSTACSAVSFERSYAVCV